jgi:flagellar biosynthetic protein FliR
LAESYSVLPPGEGLPLDKGAEAVVGAVAASLGLALRLAAPLVLGAVLGQVALGLVARLAPNLQIYAVAGAGQILAGLLLLALVLPAVVPVWAAAMQDAFLHLTGPR